ncbi:unnamed protein product [Microthlaspi erraticum]|uniref:PHD-type domain-containing protein n=1 Tax=Microthlaspi erraticum TaxID=1685480 RepID=A0A6D2I7I7_9BRAS|nr:unnamed protein product [Microthlaspi erraticum]
MDSDSELKLVSLISQLLNIPDVYAPDWESKIISLSIQITSLVKSMDFASQPKPESKLMSLVTQTVSLFNSMDLDSLPKPLWKIISLISQRMSIDSDQKPKSGFNLHSLVDQTLELKTEPDLISLIRQIVFIVISMNQNSKKFISLCPQLQGEFSGGKFEASRSQEITGFKWSCFIGNWDILAVTGRRGEDATHFLCRGCHGKQHQEYEKVPIEIKHPLHPNHSLQLVWNWLNQTRKCYCCDEDLIEVFYYCKTCDYAMNIACVEKSPLSHKDCPKWHEHTLALFPRRKASLNCNICSLADSSSPLYMCPPCDFVVHQKCFTLPHLIRICRHPHRILFTPSFDERDWSCSICRRKIDNEYGGYSCTKDGCLYAAHSRCATQSNVWDGTDLVGVPEETEEEIVEPFVRISDGIIRHFSHEHHLLRLDENTHRDYDENRQCQACITPIYFGRFYSCVQCEFVLHETCANLSRKLYHPTHPHLFTLALIGGTENVVNFKNLCFTCGRLVTAGFFYECRKEECKFKLHVHCATISEPLVREIHAHPLFLTSKPEERRECCLCYELNNKYTTDTFNCIECDRFSMCFRCAAIPEKVRHKHDKHILTLSYGEETSTTKKSLVVDCEKITNLAEWFYMYNEDRRTTGNWCEGCERKIEPKEWFYMCDEDCCVTLHMECLIGRDLYLKPGSSFTTEEDVRVSVLPNNHHMSRPICSSCEKRCSHKIVFHCSASIFCCLTCWARGTR